MEANRECVRVCVHQCLCRERRVCDGKKKEASTGCQSSPSHSLSLLDRAHPGENGSPWDPERRKEQVLEGRRRQQGGGDCLPVSVTQA